VRKQEHVPETRDTKANRAMRRHPEKVEPIEETRLREAPEEIRKRGADDDVSVRAKSSGHGKKTADKWNQ
jgi:hypothetical protein